MQIDIDPHALDRAKQRGASVKEIHQAVEFGEEFPAQKGRTAFRRNFSYQAMWNEKYYENKQLEVFAAKQHNGWYVITVIVRFF